MHLEEYDAADASTLIRVHQKNYAKGLEFMCKTAAPTMLDSAPTYATKSTYADAMRGVVRRARSWMRCVMWRMMCVRRVRLG